MQWLGRLFRREDKSVTAPGDWTISGRRYPRTLLDDERVKEALSDRKRVKLLWDKDGTSFRIAASKPFYGHLIGWLKDIVAEIRRIGPVSSGGPVAAPSFHDAKEKIGQRLIQLFAELEASEQLREMQDIKLVLESDWLMFSPDFSDYESFVRHCIVENGDFPWYNAHLNRYRLDVALAAESPSELVLALFPSSGNE